MGIWSRKTLKASTEEAFAAGASGLKRSLGIAALTAFGVGSTVGAGIFSLTGDVAAHMAGPAVALAFVLASGACFFSGLCYAELAALLPISGSAYSYAYVTLGELIGWTIGWSLILEWLLSASVVAISWSSYVTATLGDLGILLPRRLTTSPVTLDAGGHWVLTGSWLNLPAVAVIGACTVLLLAETRKSAAVNTLIVLAKVLALVALIVFGAGHVDPRHWKPFIPPNTGPFGQFGWSGVARAAATLFFAFLGFDGVATLAEEARNPQRTVPWSLFACLLICTVLYVGVSLVLTGLVDYRSLDVADPLYYAVSRVPMSVGAIQWLVAVVAIVGLISVVLTCIAGQARIFHSMARDGLLPAALARLSPCGRSPYVATLVTGVLAASIAGLLPLDVLGELISMGTLLAFASVCVGVVILRRIAAQEERRFRTPWVPVVPAIGVLSCVGLMCSLPVGTWARLAGWIAIGTCVYGAYGRRHSKLNAQARGPRELA